MEQSFKVSHIVDVLSDEPEYVHQEYENTRNAQLLTKEEAQKILEENMGIVHSLANKFAYNRNDADEITSVAYMGYIKAINGYDPNKLTKDGKPIKFVTFAFRCITNEILFYIRNEHKERDNIIPMNTMISVDKNGNELQLEDIISDEDQDIEGDCVNKDTVELVMQIVNQYLTPEERFIILSRFGIKCAQLTQSQIADQIDMSQANISKKEKSILQKIKVIMISKYGRDISY
jgi:RNA polymerase sporulation-specific sigma factor